MGKIESLIHQLENEIANSPRPKLGSGNKRVVDCDALFEIIRDLKVSIPHEVRQAQNVYQERETIFKNAQEEAAAMKALARKECEKLIARENILNEARNRAKGIVERAEANADTLADGSRNYTDAILVDLQRYMREYIGIIEKNRAELRQAYRPPSQTEAEPIEYPQAIVQAAHIPPETVGAANHQQSVQQEQSASRLDDAVEPEFTEPPKEKKTKSWFSRFSADDDSLDF